MFLAKRFWNSTNVPTNFNEDWTINFTFGVLTKKTDLSNCGNVFFNGPPYTENCPALGGHVFQRTKTIFKLTLRKTAPPLTAIFTINVTSTVNVDEGRATHNSDHKRST
ncbi:hypothetical protein DPMN_059291 [Dreissena polymorpha]|uniref:Uncharacterized protein n=1 Tax=Dreissena polymorpha TaxID=45954 RepID=A0A9D4HEW3_DREPO|nr:hypothetical protein DPMN_059291 [Dreissena polymorpha]